MKNPDKNLSRTFPFRRITEKMTESEKLRFEELREKDRNLDPALRRMKLKPWSSPRRLPPDCSWSGPAIPPGEMAKPIHEFDEEGRLKIKVPMGWQSPWANELLKRKVNKEET